MYNRNYAVDPEHEISTNDRSNVNDHGPRHQLHSVEDVSGTSLEERRASDDQQGQNDETNTCIKETEFNHTSGSGKPHKTCQQNTGMVYWNVVLICYKERSTGKSNFVLISFFNYFLFIYCFGRDREVKFTLLALEIRRTNYIHFKIFSCYINISKFSMNGFFFFWKLVNFDSS